MAAGSHVNDICLQGQLILLRVASKSQENCLQMLINALHTGARQLHILQSLGQVVWIIDESNQFGKQPVRNI